MFLQEIAMNYNYKAWIKTNHNKTQTNSDKTCIFKLILSYGIQVPNLKYFECVFNYRAPIDSFFKNKLFHIRFSSHSKRVIHFINVSNYIYTIYLVCGNTWQVDTHGVTANTLYIYWYLTKQCLKSYKHKYTVPLIFQLQGTSTDHADRIVLICLNHWCNTFDFCITWHTETWMPGCHRIIKGNRTTGNIFFCGFHRY